LTNDSDRDRASLSRRGVLAGGTALVAGPATGAAPTFAGLSFQPGTRLDMLIRFFRADGRERGRERVAYDFNADGTIAMNAHSESFDPPVVRNAIYLLGKRYEPISCHLQILNDGRHAGSGWYDCGASTVELTGDRSGDGRISRRYSMTEPLTALVAHPVSTDVLVGMAADRAAAGIPHIASGVYLTSSDPYGRTGPDLVRADVKIAYLGVEVVSTPAGPVGGDHYLLYLPTANKGYQPFQDLWCIAGTPVFLKAYARQPVDTRYEISELSFKTVELPGAGLGA